MKNTADRNTLRDDELVVIFEHVGSDGCVGLSFDVFDVRDLDMAKASAASNAGVVCDAFGCTLADYRAER